jgi:hypothetical protein
LAFGNEQILDFSSSPTIDLERSHCSISCADSWYNCKCRLSNHYSRS